MSRIESSTVERGRAEYGKPESNAGGSKTGDRKRAGGIRRSHEGKGIIRKTIAAVAALDGTAERKKREGRWGEKKNTREDIRERKQEESD